MTAAHALVEAGEEGEEGVTTLYIQNTSIVITGNSAPDCTILLKYGAMVQYGPRNQKPERLARRRVTSSCNGSQLPRFLVNIVLKCRVLKM